MTPELKKLNLGCGYKRLDDHWNVDIESKFNPDQVLDMEVTPWPYEDDFFEMITADNILEHVGLDPNVFTNIMKEMYRVSADKAEWVIRIPHHRCDLAYDDYTHVRRLTEKTFKMFDQQVNFEGMNRKLSDSVFGMVHEIDIEVYDTDYKLVEYWKNQVDSGMLGPLQLNINLNTMANVVETVSIFARVHKPGRFKGYLSQK